jgi:hypothetical protein
MGSAREEIIIVIKEQEFVISKEQFRKKHDCVEFIRKLAQGEPGVDLLTMPSEDKAKGGFINYFQNGDLYKGFKNNPKRRLNNIIVELLDPPNYVSVKKDKFDFVCHGMVAEAILMHLDDQMIGDPSFHLTKYASWIRECYQDILIYIHLFVRYDQGLCLEPNIPDCLPRSVFLKINEKILLGENPALNYHHCFIGDMDPTSPEASSRRSGFALASNMGLPRAFSPTPVSASDRGSSGSQHSVTSSSSSVLKSRSLERQRLPSPALSIRSAHRQSSAPSSDLQLERKYVVHPFSTLHLNRVKSQGAVPSCFLPFGFAEDKSLSSLFAPASHLGRVRSHNSMRRPISASHLSREQSIGSARSSISSVSSASPSQSPSLPSVSPSQSPSLPSVSPSQSPVLLSLSPSQSSASLSSLSRLNSSLSISAAPSPSLLPQLELFDGMPENNNPPSFAKFWKRFQLLEQDPMQNEVKLSGAIADLSLSDNSQTALGSLRSYPDLGKELTRERVAKVQRFFKESSELRHKWTLPEKEAYVKKLQDKLTKYEKDGQIKPEKNKETIQCLKSYLNMPSEPEGVEALSAEQTPFVHVRYLKPRGSG